MNAVTEITSQTRVALPRLNEASEKDADSA